MIDAESRAIRAKQLLDDELLATALDGLEADALNTALQANTFDPNEAVSAICHLRAAHSVRQQLRSVLTTGKAEKQKRPAVA